MKKFNLSKGFKRIAIILCIIWALFVLLGIPTISENKDEKIYEYNFGLLIQNPQQSGSWFNMQTIKYDYNQRINENGYVGWWKNFFSKVEMPDSPFDPVFVYPILILLLPPLALFILLRAIIWVVKYVKNGFKDENVNLEKNNENK